MNFNSYYFQLNYVNFGLKRYTDLLFLNETIGEASYKRLLLTNGHIHLNNYFNLHACLSFLHVAFVKLLCFIMFIGLEVQLDHSQGGVAHTYITF